MKRAKETVFRYSGSRANSRILRRRGRKVTTAVFKGNATGQKVERTTLEFRGLRNGDVTRREKGKRKGTLLSRRNVRHENKISSRLNAEKDRWLAASVVARRARFDRREAAKENPLDALLEDKVVESFCRAIE
ncbi:hypothetical protein HZH66_013733 [Vespula vulgaris]|uniref:Uncharacterized protein n=1 Tax=Vespula vulgaris TaxID=7454 RepID=A0A834J423_VESVU|nr:hypothetical protein HZH66_013733 [Vespula vulgaris]